MIRKKTWKTRGFPWFDKQIRDLSYMPPSYHISTQRRGLGRVGSWAQGRIFGFLRNQGSHVEGGYLAQIPLIFWFEVSRIIALFCIFNMHMKEIWKVTSVFSPYTNFSSVGVRIWKFQGLGTYMGTQFWHGPHPSMCTQHAYRWPEISVTAQSGPNFDPKFSTFLDLVCLVGAYTGPRSGQWKVPI